MSSQPEPVFVHSCPWCPTKVVDAGFGAAIAYFEFHLDQHAAAGEMPLAGAA